MKGRKLNWTTDSRIGRLGRTSHVAITREIKASVSTHRVLPRVNSLINDNYCVSLLPDRLLTRTSALPRKTTNCLSLNVKHLAANHVHSAPGHSQKRELSPRSAGCYQSKSKLKYVKGASSVIQLSCVQPVTNAMNVVSNLPVGARLQNFWQTWLERGAGPKIVQILREGYTLPFRIRPNLTRSPTVISRYVNPHTNSYLLEALHQLMDKNAIELVHNQTSLGFFNRLFMSADLSVS